MGSEQQETKSLPRNRKCGNCRYFEPAPLWRKGWCRNPQLYPPHANHLVDSTSIDCEGGFRSRIYWEPLPVSENAPTQPTPSMGTAPITPRPYDIGSDAADSGQAESPRSGFFNSISFQREPSRPKLEEDEFFRSAPPVVEPEIEDEPLPVKADGKDWRAEVRRIAPFTRSWPLERIDPVKSLPWVVAGFLAIIVLFMVIGGNKNKDAVAPDSIRASAVLTQNAQLLVTTPANATMNAALQGSATPAVSPTATASALQNKQATIGGLGGDKLRLRAQPNISSDILAQLQDGDKVKILEGPVDSDKLEWYKVEVNGKVGWVVKKYVVVQ